MTELMDDNDIALLQSMVNRFGFYSVYTIVQDMNPNDNDRIQSRERLALINELKDKLNALL